ncbi:MAG: CocE/NonD family hydrolase, partial [Acidobacteria bacterium]|nr:CocE/NonD family hydrolase [Acidobacteriota bacterium]
MRRDFSRRLRFLFPLLPLLPLLPSSLPAPAQQSFTTEKDVAIPMRDGVVLRADIWRPASEGKFPVLVYRTPYDKRRAPESYATYRKAVERGYAVVMQDVRGRYASAGEFLPYQQEGKDGYDTIEWTAAQPWSNGAVGTFGLSYPGAVQWLAAMERPPHLKAMVPAMTFSTPRNFFYSGGVFDGSWIGWIWNNIAPDARVKKNLPGPKTGAEARAAFEKDASKLQGRLPLMALDELKGVAPWYFDWMRHEPSDAWWEWCELRGKYARTDAAVLNLSGWYDEAYGP